MLKSTQNNDRLVAVFTIGFVAVFLAFALFDLKHFSSVIQSLFSESANLFGYWWQWLMVINFVLALAIGGSKFGKLKLGATDTVSMSRFRWVAMIMCTLLAGGGVFWSAAEPIYHFMTPPPALGEMEAGVMETVAPALSQSFFHWGFLAWAVLGTLATIVLMYAHHQAGVRLRPRALLYPLLGDKLENHWLGSVIDACSIIAVAAGTIGPIGFLATQLGYSLESFVGIENTMPMQMLILAAVVAIYSISAFTGMDKGLQWLSRMNVIGAAVLLGAVIVLGPTGFIFEQFGSGFSYYLNNMHTLALNTDNGGWNAWWTWFFWGWFIGFAPMMAIFIARISKGRSIRELIFAVAICAPIATNFWFSVLGGTGIFYELQSPGSISGPMADAGLPAILIASLSQLPYSVILIPAFMLLTTTFVATTGDSMAYSIAMAVSGDNQPTRKHRLFWAIVMGLVAGVLLLAGDGGLNALQSFIVITAVPVSFLIAFTFITGPIAVMRMQKEKEANLALEPATAN